MDALQNLCDEFIRLYRQQLNVWILGNVGKLKDAAIRRYDSRQERLEELGKELGRMMQAREPRGFKIEPGEYSSRFRPRARRGIDPRC